MQCSELNNEAMVSFQSTVRHCFARDRNILFFSKVSLYVLFDSNKLLFSAGRMDGQTTKQQSQSFFLKLSSYKTNLLKDRRFMSSTSSLLKINSDDRSCRNFTWHNNIRIRNLRILYVNRQ